MMDSIEKLREAAKQPDGGFWSDEFNEIADEIEREIAERYQLCPTDADGLPIHVGDVMTIKSGQQCKVVAIGETQFTALRHREPNPVCQANLHHHYHAPTVEDVLEEFYDALGWDEADNHALKRDEIIAAYADKLREVLEDD